MLGGLFCHQYLYGWRNHPQNPQVESITFAEGTNMFGGLFAPKQIQCRYMKSFFNRQLEKNEPYLIFLSVKCELYQLGWLRVIDFETLRLEAIKGLANPEAPEGNMYKEHCSTWT